MIFAVGHLLICAVVAWVLLDTWVSPLRAVVRGDLHGDSSILTWDLWNVTESVLRGENPYETRLLYFPIGANLTAHTYGPGFLPVGLAAKALDGGDPMWPIAAYRALIGLCFALGLFTAFHALRALGASPLAAAAGSVAWAFAPVFRSRALETHLVAAAFLIPAATWALTRLVGAPTAGRAFAVGSGIAACVYFSEYYAPFLWLALIVVTIGAFAWPDTRAWMTARIRALAGRGVAAAGAGLLLAAAPFLLNWHPSKALRFRESQAYFESANLAGFVLPDRNVTPVYSATPLARWNDHLRHGVGGANVFLGFPVLLFGIIGAFRAREPRARALLILATVFLTLSLGPELKVLATNTGIVLPYRALMLVPPFDLARAPARLAALALWGLVGLMALGLTSTQHRLSPRWGLALGLATVAWCLLEVRAPGPDVDTFEPPAELSTLAPGGVANLPLSTRDSFAMLLQVFHGRPIATGYVSRITDEESQHVGRLDALLRRDPQAFARSLQEMGIGNVVAAQGTPEEVVAALRTSPLHLLDLRSLE